MGSPSQPPYMKLSEVRQESLSRLISVYGASNHICALGAGYKPTEGYYNDLQPTQGSQALRNSRNGH